MDTKTLAIILLCGHIVAVTIILSVLYRQTKILLNNPDPELHTGRMALLLLALGALASNVAPITIDTMVLADAVHRAHPTTPGIIYATSNVLGLVWEAAAILALYIFAERLLGKKR